MEKVYKTMNAAGKFNLIVGICVIAVSVLSCLGGAFMIVNGAKLLERKKEILF